LRAETEAGESGFQQETVSSATDPPCRLRNTKESDWRYRLYNTCAGCEAVRKAI
jgi:hypothetical protein